MGLSNKRPARSRSPEGGRSSLNSLSRWFKMRHVLLHCVMENRQRFYFDEPIV